MSGMVKDPVIATFAAALPVIDPTRELLITAIMPGPPCILPATTRASNMKNLVPPRPCKTPPNKTNKKMKLAEVGKTMPYMPF